MKKRITAFLLAGIMFAASSVFSYASDTAGKMIEKTVEESTEEDVEEIKEESTKENAEKTEEESVVDNTEEAEEESVVDNTEEAEEESSVDSTEETAEESAENSTEEQAVEVIEKPENSMVESYLTGLPVEESIGRQRPVSVMLGNCYNGAPQSGLSNAGVVYEAPVEGEITRLMGIFEDYQDIERIGSIRSCRDYFLLYSNEFDAVYTHWGQSVFAKTYLDNHDIDNLNGIASSAFYRSSHRSAPHNGYTNYDLIQEGIDSMGYRRELREDYYGHYVFVPEGTRNTLPNGTDANVVRFNNFYDNHPWFEYDDETGKYKRFQFGAAHIDELTGEQLTCDNIIIQYSSCSLYASHMPYLKIDPISGGTGKYITNGKAIDIIWMKDAPWGVTHYITMDNQELQINRGTTWVEIVQDDRIDEVLYE